MIRIVINIRPNTTNINTVKEENNPAKKNLGIKIVTWAGAIAATLACANDAIEILARMGIL